MAIGNVEVRLSIAPPIQPTCVSLRLSSYGRVTVLDALDAREWSVNPSSLGHHFPLEVGLQILDPTDLASREIHCMVTDPAQAHLMVRLALGGLRFENVAMQWEGLGQ